MLAYVFWHRPTAGSGDAAYEEALRAFHGALAAAPPGGFSRSWSYRLDRVPWLGAGGPGYEDWYLVDGFAALGELNESAVSGPRRAPHDAVAARAAEGSGGVYLLVAGEPRPQAGGAAWLSKPAGTTHPEFLAGARELGAAAWQRQMTLGPTPEFCVHDPAGDLAGAVRLALASV